MHYVGQSLWGCTLLAVILDLAIVMVLSPFTPAPRGRRRETPLEILQRRYAEGEIATAEYEKRKAKLECDAKLTK